MFRFGDPGGRGYNAVGTSNVNLIAWWGTVASTFWSVSAGNGRTGGSSLRATAGPGTFVTRTLTSQSVWGVALAMRIGSSPASIAIVNFIDVATSQILLNLNTDGTLSLKSGATILGTSTNVITLNTYNHIEVKVTIHNTAGTAEVRVNGVTWIGPLSSINSRVSANNSANSITISSPVNPTDFDDIIIYDGQTNDPQGNPDIHDWIGDCGLTWLLPSGAGTTTQYTPLASTNFSQVNEATPDGDTSYVSDATVGHLDTYAIANLGANISTVKSLAVVNYARKDDVGSRSFAPEIRTNSANFDGVTQPLGNSYAYYFSNWGQNPSGTPANWTTTDVNNLEAGQKTIA